MKLADHKLENEVKQVSYLNITIFFVFPVYVHATKYDFVHHNYEGVYGTTLFQQQIVVQLFWIPIEKFLHEE